MYQGTFALINAATVCASADAKVDSAQAARLNTDPDAVGPWAQRCGNAKAAYELGRRRVPPSNIARHAPP